MAPQAVDRPETVVAPRRSRLTPEREQEFFDAVLEQIRECGYDAVTMEGVAATTRCSKSTLYRQWRTKPRFVAAALRSSSRSRFTGIDTGSLAEDLRQVARTAGEWSGQDTRLLQALGHAITTDSELKRALRETLVEPEVAALREILRRGVERGEVDAGNPALEFVPAQLFGVLRIRPVLEGEYADPDYLVRFMEAAVLPALGLGSRPRPPSTG
ncbi:TetR family transcriptional regulator [Streptomyces sp. NTH33]|uniref:TetR/AcrR family transcriptional regulator n=1 Tax=Streptomyces sp. NTH33 TaxID=1735453 RepID=UPI000DA9AE05|nr:TetR/AcrR family transcriptional regulator [Streptomyces sp. NTH33]PZH13117.1 TetR family transcriptional regulator [Streptomyces sp. NTH33]